MSEHLRPTYQELTDLSIVVSNVEEIVSDSPYGTNYLRGLLALGSSEVKANKHSKLRWSLTNKTVLSSGEPEKIIELLPGADSLGEDRSERLSSLLSRLPEIKAYRWFSRQKPYVNALQTMSRLEKRLPAYGSDIREFNLLRAVLTPMSVFQFQTEHGIISQYPTKEELHDAYKHARALSIFVKQKNPIYRVFEVSPFLDKALEKLVTELDKKRETYRKPLEDKTLREREFRDQIIRSLFAFFGECSPALAGHLLELIGYRPDTRHLSEKIKEHRQTVRRLALADALKGGVKT